MAIETITSEGDYVIKSQHSGDLLRIQRHVIICDISEAKELRDWLTRRLEEEI